MSSHDFRLSRIRRRGFVLLETVLAVGVFSIGVVALGWCVDNCILAETAKGQDDRARRALENEMALIESGAKPLANTSVEELKGMFQGMTMKTTRAPLKEKNEKRQEIVGIYNVRLEVGWKIRDENYSREVEFYYQPKQR